MPQSNYSRSPRLMAPSDTVLVVVDVQEKLLPSIKGHQMVEWNVGRLVRAAGILEIPCILTEQYPKGLGPTTNGIISCLVDRTGESKNLPIEKTSFSCLESPEFMANLTDLKRPNAIICGIEGHVCVLQTVLDLLAEGVSCFVPRDAIGSRNEIDLSTATSRMSAEGAQITTTETAIFEWCRTAQNTCFKALQALVKEHEPQVH